MKVRVALALSLLVVAFAVACKDDGLGPKDIGLTNPYGDWKLAEIVGDHDPQTLRIQRGVKDPEIIRVRRKDLYRLQKNGSLRHIDVADLNVGDSIRVWYGEDSGTLERGVAVIP